VDKSKFVEGDTFAPNTQFLKSMATVGKGFAQLGSHSLMDIDAAYGSMLDELKSPQALFSMARASKGFANQMPGLQAIQANKQLYNTAGSFSPFQGKMADLLSRYHALPQMQMPGQQTGGTNTGGVASLGGDWSGVDKWNPDISAASAKYGVPGNLIKAVMYLESGGADAPPNGAGAMGPMQIVGSIWSGLGYDLSDPHQNIMAGAAILQQMYQSCGSWEGAVNSYYSGSCQSTGARDDPAQGGSGRTDASYTSEIISNWHMLDGQGGTNPSLGQQKLGMGGSATGAMGAVDPSAFAGGQSFPVTQEIGGGAMDYSNYDYTLGVSGHPGIDIGMPMNTQVTTPWSGTVVCLGGASYGNDLGGGGCGAFADDAGGIGRVQLRLDNGDHIIFGHMHASNLQLGQRVDAGSIVGLSGTAGSGPHLHAEYRRAGANTPSGFQAVDFRTMTGMNVTGGGTNAGGGYNVGQSSGLGILQGVRGLPSWYGAYRPGSIQRSRGVW
jgi:murein DD-endopeptidase MepM/ murein hydrolase activator NlpD